MIVGELLRRLDQWLLPRLANGLMRIARIPAGRRALAGTAAVLLVTTVIAVVWSRDRPVAVDDTVGDVVRVGVPQGQSIPDYVHSARRELAALGTGSPPGATYALVTLTGYLAPDRLTAALHGVGLSAVFARVPLPDTQTEIVRIEALLLPGDVHAGMAAVAERKDREALGYQDLTAKLTGSGDQERALRARYASGARVAAAEATAYRSNCSCLYAAVVRGTAAELNQVARRAGVRAVDPAPEVHRIDRAVFLPPLPEQQGIAQPPEESGTTPTPPW